MQVLILSFYFLLLAILSTFIINIITNTKGIEITHNEPENVEIERVEEVVEEIETFRLTHYYTGDPYGSGTCTASGLCINRFDTNEKGWYTYKNRLVVANGVEYPLWTELTLVIDNVEYQAIVLDICGYCKKERRIDLFVSSKKFGIDRQTIGVKNGN